jgi:hypothetical protein
MNLRTTFPVLGLLMLAAACGADPDAAAVDRALQANGGEAAASGPPGPAIDPGLPIGRRVGLWARRYADAGAASYCFGLADSGYAALGRLVLDERHDCISLVYRVTELARSGGGRGAVAAALATRFAGADPADVVDQNGLVDYDHPTHLDYSLDMVRSGHWGRDVTGTMHGSRPDSLGTARYPAGSYLWVPEADLREDDLREGDIAWLVLAPEDSKARGLRDEYGLVIGHVGVVVIDDGRPWLIHAASSPLPPWYEGGRIARVPLAEYLARVERYGGLIVTRAAAAEPVDP